MIKILRMGEVPKEEIFARDNPTANVSDAVASIIAEVRAGGDKALRDCTERFDGVKLDSLSVSRKEIDEAYKTVGPAFLAVLQEAAENIRTFHKKQVREGFRIGDAEDGKVTGQKITPIERVGLYVPGGTAAYPSTVLMDAIPAKIAGCKTIVMVTPPAKDGKVNPAILAAADVAGVEINNHT